MDILTLDFKTIHKVIHHYQWKFKETFHCINLFLMKIEANILFTFSCKRGLTHHPLMWATTKIKSNTQYDIHKNGVP